MKKHCLLYIVMVCVNYNCISQCNSYFNFYNMPDLYAMEYLLPIGNNQFYSTANYYALHAGICKLDSLGDTLWTKQYCGVYFTDLEYSLDSNLVAVNGFNQACGPTAGHTDIGFYKFDLNGDTIFTKVFGTTDIDDNPKIAVLSDSTYIVTFHTSAGPNAYHLDANGNILNISNMPFFYIFDIKEGLDDYVYYCGFVGDVGMNYPTFEIAKTNKNIDTLFWLSLFDTSGGWWGDWFSSMAMLPDSNIMVTGRNGTYKINYQTGDSIWKNNLGGGFIYRLKDSTYLLSEGQWLHVTNTNGDSLWSKHFLINANNWLELNSIVQLDDGCFAALGIKEYSSSTFAYYPFFAYFDSLFNFPLNVGLEDLPPENSFTVFPNPVSYSFTISTSSFQNESNLVFILYDVNGRVVIKKDFQPGEEIDVSTVSDGIYFGEVSSKTKTVRGKVLVQH